MGCRLPLTSELFGRPGGVARYCIQHVRQLCHRSTEGLARYNLLLWGWYRLHLLTGDPVQLPDCALNYHRELFADPRCFRIRQLQASLDACCIQPGAQLTANTPDILNRCQVKQLSLAFPTGEVNNAFRPSVLLGSVVGSFANVGVGAIPTQMGRPV